jgi:pimeloyl-ACP methyl ester carboxylesterase
MLMRWPARWRRPVRFVGDVAILAVLIYLGLAGYLYAYQIDLVFRPPPTGSLYTASLGLAPERVLVGGRDGLSTEAWRVPARPAGDPAAAGSDPASAYWVLYLHGNAASISSAPNLRRYHQLRQLGLNVLAVEYPGFGNVGGRASEAGMHAAARAAYDRLRQIDGVPADRIAIYGWSLGTGAAVPLARDVDEAALIVEGGFTSVLARATEEHPYMPVAWLLQHPFRSVDAIAATGSATLFLHSPDDSIIPLHHGEAMFAKAAEPKRLVRLAGGHIHPNAEDADRYLAAIHDFLSGVLRWRLAPPRRSAGMAVAKALRDGGVEAARAAWRTALAEGDARWNLAEYELQHVGRQCTLTGRHEAAIALLRTNRDRFPASPLAWYELGRALAAAGHDDDARRALQHSIALEPAAVNPSHGLVARLD